MTAPEIRSDHTLGWLPLPRFVHDLTIAQRVRIGFGVGAAVVLIISLAASVLIRRVTDTLGGVVEQVRAEQVTVMNMKDAVSSENGAVEGYLITRDQSFLNGLNDGHAAFTQAAEQLNGPHVDSQNRAAGAEILDLEAEFQRLARQEVDLSQEGSPDAAAFHWQTEGRQAEQALRRRLDQIVARSLQHLNVELANARLREEQTRYIFAPIVALTAIFSFLTALLASRSITRRFARLEHTVERIERGDFRVEIQETKRDELGKLGSSIGDMARALETETRQREQLLEERERANERITVLYDVARTVNQTLDTSEVLHLALAKLLAHTNMQAGIALLRDDATERFRVAMVEGMSEEAAAELAGRFEDEDAQQFAATLMAREGITRLNLLRLPIEAGPFRAAVAVPLKARGSDCGVLILATPEELDIETDEVRLLEGLAKQIGTALEHARLYSQSRQLAAAEERNRLARELHDSVTQSLFSMSMMSQALPSLIERNHERAAEHAMRLSELARGALAEMRMFILELRPAALQEMGLVLALERHVAGFASREGLEASFRVDGLQRKLPHEQGEALFRITQEALNNITRHAHAQNIAVALEFQPTDVRLTVEDDGVGMTGEQVSGGFGLISMRERAEQLGGSFEIEPRPGHGLRVIAAIPAPAPTTSITR